jgi:hypothetical protein
LGLEADIPFLGFLAERREMAQGYQLAATNIHQHDSCRCRFTVLLVDYPNADWT